MNKPATFKNPFEENQNETVIVLRDNTTTTSIQSTPTAPTIQSKLEQPKLTQINSDSIFSDECMPPVVQLNEDGDPPLLEDIGINIEKVRSRLLLVIKLQQPVPDMVSDPDLVGPFAIALALGFLLLFAGKIHFGDIYAMFIVGNILSYLLINLMSKADIIPLYNVMSILGYALLPMLPLAAIDIFLELKSSVGVLLSLSFAVWSSIAAGNMINILQQQVQSHRPLTIYPLFLFYVCFAIIVIF